MDIAVILYTEAEYYRGDIGETISKVAKEVCMQDSVYAEIMVLGISVGSYIKSAVSEEDKLIRDVLITIYEAVTEGVLI